jgi:hypothetical protein
MIPVIAVVVLALLALVFFLWFRRTPTYRLHRQRSGTVGPNNVGIPRWYGDRNVPPLRRDELPARARRWRFGRRT